MRWSIKIARIAGIEVRIHITFLLFLAWIGFTYYKVGGPAAATEGVLFILALFGCVLLHEFGHALSSYTNGSVVERLQQGARGTCDASGICWFLTRLRRVHEFAALSYDRAKIGR